MTQSTVTIECNATTATGLVSGTPVMTLAGEMPVECLSAGDRLVTGSGARALVAVRSTVLPKTRLVCISPSALGIDQPEEDMRVMPDQGIHIRDWRAKALKGFPEAIIPAQELVDGEYIRFETAFGTRIYTLEFERAEVIYAGSVKLTCAPALINA
ncbi:Hint domain-containing protein [Pseudorhodobacter sp. W20_MBD10_FR17]|uniref:Hint domain-containing protein n=1 Tax=Pseudorhodobacter sp. W20_MBD10_FR17 TaxID=3240266 RepID=UPI003F95D0FB